MNVPRASHLACLPIALALALAPANPAQVAAERDAGALATFDSLSFRQKAALLRNIERQIEGLSNPTTQRILAWRGDTTTLPEREPAPVFDPDVYAKGVAPARRIVAADQPAHAEVRARFPAPPFLDDLHREVHYDWCRGVIVKSRAPLGYREMFENYLRGYPPGSDHAVAHVLARLDRDPAVRKLAAWFGHTYANLNAEAFPGVTLYDAWYSGDIVDVPDVDAIPFAWEILGRKQMRSPLSGAPRDRLYADIQRGARRYRVHRTTCEAAAAAVVHAEPVLDPMYARLVPRFHYLFAANDDSLDAVAALLADRDRDRLLAEVDARIVEPDGAAFELRERRKAELEAMAAALREISLRALERIAGTGR
jgi:hypothetical protein